ncbi:MAG TPA: Sua5/YciO/YrdC/YwlC family protein [Gemmataceae bacterium]|jgi:protein-tyrosine phosphatase|nr:Sua5/YciO/YrdC/YwlC family protein [Gemmataceae bacterium]
MPELLRWSNDTETRNRVLHELRAGQVVAVPTESGYEAAAFGLDAAAVARLASLAGDEHPVAVAIRSHHEVRDWAPTIRGVAARLLRTYTPGPFVAIVRGGEERGLAGHLPSDVHDLVLRNQGVPLRWPDRDDFDLLLAGLGGPLLMTRLCNDPRTPQAAAEAPEIDLVLDAGLSPMLVPPTVVHADSTRYRLIREGAIAPGDLDEAARCRILFVCTGNTCRSPMAKALCRRLLADTLGCGLEELADHGYEVESAGMAANAGSEASPEAAVLVRKRGAELSDHRSQPLTADLLARADHLFLMTADHLRMLRGVRGLVGPQPQLLSPDGEDVTDPIGWPQDVYEECASQIWEMLQRRLPQILER